MLAASLPPHTALSETKAVEARRERRGAALLEGQRRSTLSHCLCSPIGGQREEALSFSLTACRPSLNLQACPGGLVAAVNRPYTGFSPGRPSAPLQGTGFAWGTRVLNGLHALSEVKVMQPLKSMG